MPKVVKQEWIGDGWKEHYSGFPADLFYSGDASLSPWERKPHLHANYSINGDLQSLTYKNAEGVNTYFFQYGAWQAGCMIAEPFLTQVRLIQQLR